MNNIEIQINKSRVVFITLIFSFTLILGVTTIYYLFKIGYISTTLVIYISFFLILSTYLFFVIFKVLFSKNAGLIINNVGIIDNISVTKLGLVEWKNIKGFRTIKMSYSDIILLDVIDTDMLMKNLNKRQKNNAKNSIQKFGTPCVINLSNLKYEKNELLKMISEYIKK